MKRMEKGAVKIQWENIDAVFSKAELWRRRISSFLLLTPLTSEQPLQCSVIYRSLQLIIVPSWACNSFFSV